MDPPTEQRIKLVVWPFSLVVTVPFHTSNHTSSFTSNRNVKRTKEDKKKEEEDKGNKIMFHMVSEQLLRPFLLFYKFQIGIIN